MVGAEISEFLVPWSLTSVNKMAFSVQKVKSHEEALKYYPKNRHREASDGVPPYELLYTVPQGRMHKALVHPIWPSDLERVQKGPHGFLACGPACVDAGDTRAMC